MGKYVVSDKIVETMPVAVSVVVGSLVSVPVSMPVSVSLVSVRMVVSLVVVSVVVVWAAAKPARAERRSSEGRIFVAAGLLDIYIYIIPGRLENKVGLVGGRNDCVCVTRVRRGCGKSKEK